MAKAPPKLPSTYYRVSVKALVFDDQQRLLVLHGEGGWELPGGGMEHDEDYAACVQRELQEEIGVAVTAVGDEEFTYRCSTQVGHPKIAIAATAKLASHDFKLEDGLTEARFVTLEEFTQLQFQKSEDGVQAYVNRIWKRRPESAMDSPMYRVTTRALIFDERMRLLVVEDNDGRYELPGGGWEHNESLEECIAREIKEELGVSTLWVGKLWFCYRGQRRGRPRFLRLCVPAQVKSTNFKMGEGMKAAHFVNRATFANTHLHRRRGTHQGAR